MGSVLGGGAAKKAAKKQAAAIDRQTNLQTVSTGYQIQALSDQMAQAASQQAATEYATTLLSKAPETVSVNLGTTDLDAMTSDLLGRRRTTRQTYQQIIPTQASGLTQLRT